MKKYKLIGKHPLFAIITIGATIFIIAPIILSLIIASIIVIPMYLVVQLFGDKE